MRDLSKLQTQIDMLQQVVLCYTDFKLNPLETAEYLQKLEFLPKTEIPKTEADWKEEETESK